MEWANQEVAFVEKRELKNLEQDQLSDIELLQLIEDRIERSPYLQDEKIIVSSISGKVTIAGKASSEASKIRIRELIESMPSVREIKNLVEVRA